MLMLLHKLLIFYMHNLNVSFVPNTCTILDNYLLSYRYRRPSVLVLGILVLGYKPRIWTSSDGLVINIAG